MGRKRKRRKAISNRFTRGVHGRVENRNQQSFSRKKTSKKKYKKQKFFAKISADGKISKKEAEKAAKKGYDLAKIQRADARQFNRAQDVYNRRSQRSGMRAPAYTPLLISRGANNIFNQASKPVAPAQVDAPPPPGVDPPPLEPTNEYQDQIENTLDQIDPNQAYIDAIASLEQQIANIQMPEFEMPEIPDYSAQLAEAQAQQAAFMEEMAAQQEAAAAQRRLSMQVAGANAARGGMQADFRIGRRAARDRMGTSGFKRRKRFRRANAIARGIGPIGAVAAGATNAIQSAINV